MSVQWLRLLHWELLLPQPFRSATEAPMQGLPITKYPLSFNGGIGATTTGKLIEIGGFSPFPGNAGFLRPKRPPR